MTNTVSNSIQTVVLYILLAAVALLALHYAPVIVETLRTPLIKATQTPNKVTL